MSDADKKVAKQQFQLFDKILSIQNVFTKKSPTPADPQKRQETRAKSKKNGEIAGLYLKGLIQDCTKQQEERQDLDAQLEKAVWSVIYETTTDLVDKPLGLEKRMKKACVCWLINK